MVDFFKLVFWRQTKNFGFLLKTAPTPLCAQFLLTGLAFCIGIRSKMISSDRPITIVLILEFGV